jgi:hypothetical protein
MSGLLSQHDLTRMAADLQAVRDDHALEIEVRRGADTLAPQTVRVARQGTIAQANDRGEMEQSSQRVVVLGDATLDIEKGDRFTDAWGQLCEVDFVRPNRRVMVVAEGRIIQ